MALDEGLQHLDSCLAKVLGNVHLRILQYASRTRGAGRGLPSDGAD
jgi:hypothetical protein